jgi:hypothetical protein
MVPLNALEGTKMELSMQERKKLSKKVAIRYRKAKKKEKSLILDEFVGYTGYNRNYAAHVLSREGKSTFVKVENKTVRLEASQKSSIPRGGRPKVYDDDVIEALKQIWGFLGYPCGKLLRPMLQAMMPFLEEDSDFNLDTIVVEKLLKISASTIDRSLQSEKRKLTLKGKSLTKSGSLLKNQIPIRVFYSWDELKVGFFELDTVSNCGPNNSGEFCQTLTITDVYSGWTETRALRNKAHRWVKERIEEIKESLAFELLGIDSDNGGEFINHQLYQWCIENNITFTRGRPYRKNDNCFVEQKNGDVVRKTVGYYRFDTDEEFEALQQVYKYLCPLRNYWFPTIKISGKKRSENGKFKKFYDKPKTPYLRILENEEVSSIVKEELKKRFQLTHPLKLKRDLDKAVANLLKVHNNKFEVHEQGQKKAFG